jgi:preprotein translocase subunit SecA
MNLFTRTFSKIFKSSNQQELDKIQNIIQAVNNKENEVKTLNEADFREKTFNFKKNAQNGTLNVDEIIPESFALVREAAKRTLGERHYDVQLAGGLILHKGMIAEMKTGEGKTLVSTLPAYLNS